MEKLVKKLSIFVFLFACVQLWGAPLSLMSISPHTHDMYASPPPHSNIQDTQTLYKPKTCEKVVTRSIPSAISLSSIQDKPSVLDTLKEVKGKTYFFYTLVFLYSVSVILVFIRISKLFNLSKG